MAFNYYTIIAGFIIGIVLFFRMPILLKAKAGKGKERIRISVIIPARNEEQNLPNILADLKKQTLAPFEIICVDDDSLDATADIIKEAGAVYVKPDKLPQGWKGKPWACQNGARAARGDVLLFIDADVRLSETAVESLSAEFLKNGKPVSVQPYHTVKKQHEYFSLFFNIIQLCVTGMSLFKGKKTGFYGPLLMIKKELFDEHEGYEAVKNEVVEDFKLGIFYNRKGTEIELLMGERQVSFRMYKNSFASLFEGWTKNFSSGSVSMKWWLLLLVFAWVSFLTALPIEIINAAIKADTTELIILCVIYVLTVALIYRAAHKMGSYPLIVCIIYPVYLVMFHVIFIYSIFATFILKTTTWKGRKL